MAYGNKGGRPRSQNPLCKFIKARLTESEFNEITERAKRSGLTVADAIRLMLFSEKLPKKIYGGLDISAARAYQNLQPLQSNLNQIAHHLNETRPEVMPHADALQIALIVRQIEDEVRVLRHEIITTNTQRGARK